MTCRPACDVSAGFYVGPSSIYTLTDSLDADTEISLHGRDRTGEWVLRLLRRR